MAARTVAPLIVIVGSTASGKTSSAIKLAKELNGEIICADSRTVYRGMDIGTAKPSMTEREGVPHWGLDLIDPDERYTTARFQQYAKTKIADIRARNKVPFLVGGTGLYIDSVIFNFDFLSDSERSEGWRSNPIDNMLMVGITTDRTVLRRRISERAEHMLSNGVVEEATILGKKYGWNAPSMTSNAYPIVAAYLKHELDERQFVDKITTQDWQLAKRQMTWFRPNSYIEWCSLADVEQYVKARVEAEY